VFYQLILVNRNLLICSYGSVLSRRKRQATNPKQFPGVSVVSDFENNCQQPASFLHRQINLMQPHQCVRQMQQWLSVRKGCSFIHRSYTICRSLPFQIL